MFHTHCVVFSSLSVGPVMLMSVIEQYLELFLKMFLTFFIIAFRACGTKYLSSNKSFAVVV